MTQWISSLKHGIGEITLRISLLQLAQQKKLWILYNVIQRKKVGFF